MDIKKKVNPGKYQQYAQKKAPKSNLLQDCLKAFFVGGLICMAGQGLSVLARDVMSLDEKTAATFVSVILVFLGAFFTGVGVYDRLGSFAGAGSAVPITGFANSIVSPAMEFKREGYVMGVGAKLFSLAGPVLVYGISTSVLVGLIYLALRALGVA